MKRNKGFSGFLPLAIGLITLTVGVALLFILPEYIISALNASGTFTAATITAAQTNVTTIRGIGMVVIIIGVIWILIGMISGGSTEAKM